jgi:hypothetical protein
MDFDLPTLLGEEPTDDEQQAALLAALKNQQSQQQTTRANLQNTLQRQQGQAGALRSLALLSSLGDNPLLRRLQQEAGSQGSQLEGLAARTEQRLGQAESGMNPLRALALKLAADKEKRLAGDAKDREKRLADQLEFQKKKSAAGAAAAKTKGEKKEHDDSIKLEGGLRKEFQATPAYKNYELAATAFDQMRQAIALDTPAGDLTAITTFMKSLDPSTGVKDQEFNNAAKAGGLVDRAQAALDYLTKGNRLTPSMRAEFLNAARRNTSVLKGQHDRVLNQYKGLAKDYNVNPNRVASGVDIDLGEEPIAPPPKPPPPQPAPKPVNPRDFSRTYIGPDNIRYGQRKDGTIVRVNEDGTHTVVKVKR